MLHYCQKKTLFLIFHERVGKKSKSVSLDIVIKSWHRLQNETYTFETVFENNQQTSMCMCKTINQENRLNSEMSDSNCSDAGINIVGILDYHIMGIRLRNCRHKNNQTESPLHSVMHKHINMKFKWRFIFEKHGFNISNIAARRSNEASLKFWCTILLCFLTDGFKEIFCISVVNGLPFL